MVDTMIDQGADRSAIERSIISDKLDEGFIYYCLSYLVFRFRQIKLNRKNNHEESENPGCPDYYYDTDNDDSGSPEAEEETDGRDCESARMILEDLGKLPGWSGFKKRMDEAITRHATGEVRKIVGLKKNEGGMHTIIIGNPGTGKSTCVSYMARIYHEMGMLRSEDIRRASASALSGGNVYGEVDSAHGGTLLIENAHEFYHSENKVYDADQQTIRTLIDTLGNKEKFSNWMLVMTGEPKGMESLLATYPELRKYFSEPIYLEDFTPDELIQIAVKLCDEKDLILTKEARKKLEMFITHKYNLRGPDFGNADFIRRLIDERIIPAMYRRITQTEDYEILDDLKRVEPEDIPSIGGYSGNAMAELDSLVGLTKIKTRLKDYLNAVRLAARRMELGLPTSMPRLHTAFLGNPGTGKTTVAEIIGKVFAEWGILSEGKVIRTEKSQMVGQYIGETEFKMNNLLARARGNILFIDEAYQLVEGGEKDFGRIVMNSLLTELGSSVRSTKANSTS